MIDHTLKVIALNEHEAVTSMTVADLLESILPARAFLPKAKLSPLDERARDRVRELHDLIQRDFEGQKKKNAEGLLADYIGEEWISDKPGSPTSGFLPPFTVAFTESLEFEDDGETVHLKSKGIFVDGESRGEALLINVERLTDEEQLERLLNKSVAVHVVHGITDSRVIAKYFADVNGKGVGVNPNLVVMADYTDGYGEITKEVFEELGIELETRRRQVSMRTEAVMTGLQARTMIAAIVKGVAVVQFGARRIPSDGVDFAKLEEVARAWLDRVFSRFEPTEFRDKSLILRSTPVSACIGALGKAFYDGSVAEQERALQVLSDPEIDWSVGVHWNGVCGKVSPTTGRFAVGGGKEYAYATWNALVEKDSGAGQQIRGLRSPELVAA